MCKDFLNYPKFFFFRQFFVDTLGNLTDILKYDIFEYQNTEIGKCKKDLR